MLGVPLRPCHIDSISDALLEGSLQDGVHPVQDLVRVEILALLERELLRVAKRVSHDIIHAYSTSVTYTLPLGLLIHVHENLLPVRAIRAVRPAAHKARGAATLELSYIPMAVRTAL